MADLGLDTQAAARAKQLKKKAAELDAAAAAVDVDSHPQVQEVRQQVLQSLHEKVVSDRVKVYHTEAQKLLSGTFWLV